VPLRPSRFPDSGGIFIFANGVRMEEISRFDRQVKQVKIWDADCTCPYSPYGHVEGRTILLTWQIDDVAFCIGWCCPIGVLTRVIYGNKCVDTWPNHWAPRVTITGWFIGLFVKCMGPRGSTPGPPP
jgi:hypothetical protein